MCLNFKATKFSGDDAADATSTTNATGTVPTNASWTTSKAWWASTTPTIWLDASATTWLSRLSAYAANAGLGAKAGLGSSSPNEASDGAPNAAASDAARPSAFLNILLLMYFLFITFIFPNEIVHFNRAQRRYKTKKINLKN